MPVDLPAASMIDSKRALQFTAVTGVFYASFFISELPSASERVDQRRAPLLFFNN